MTTGTEATASYAALLAEVQPRSITSDAAAETVQAQIDRLLDLPARSADQEALLSLLGDLIEVWEADRFAVAAPMPAEAIRALLEAHGRTQQELVGPVFATKSIASEVLSGKRGLTYDHVERLAGYFQVSPAVFYPHP